MIVPSVTIEGLTRDYVFEDVVVTPHNLRDDMFQEGVVTGIDVIMSLGDQGLLDYTLKWYESIGTAGVVKDYWVESIGDDASRGRCGFVYETGGDDMRSGNHIHIPSDIKPLNSPDYALWFWICI